MIKISDWKAADFYSPALFATGVALSGCNNNEAFADSVEIAPGSRSPDQTSTSSSSNSRSPTLLAEGARLTTALPVPCTPA